MRAYHYRQCMAKLSLFALTALTATACQESLEEKASRDAKEYTRKHCPTPFINSTRTDSVTFDSATRTYTYHCTFKDILDNQEVINQNKAAISQGLTQSMLESTNMKPYVQAGFHFQYVCRSSKDPKNVLLTVKF